MLQYCAKFNDNLMFLPHKKGSGLLEFGEFCQLAAKFLVEEDEEALKKELKEAFRIYDKEGEEIWPKGRRVIVEILEVADYLDWKWFGLGM